MENNNQNWINDLNKKLEEQRTTYKASLESGKALSKRNSYASSLVSNESRSNGGKLGSVTGTKNLEKARSVPGHQSKAAKISGDNNKKSGHTKIWSKAGADASSLKYKQYRLEKLQYITDNIESNKEYTYKELQTILKQGGYKGDFICDETPEFLINVNPGKGKVALYKKCAFGENQ